MGLLSRLLRGGSEPADGAPVCPLCGQELVGVRGTRLRPQVDPLSRRDLRDELIVHCPVHGHAPYNTR
jgi:hypothetical protein